MKLRASIIVAIALATTLAGIAAAQDDLNPDAKQVAVVRQEHLAELMKIPHVVGVATELSDDGDVVLDLEVDKAENATDVEREAPSEVDGFPVDVDVVEHAEVSPNIPTFSSFGSLDNSR